MPEQGGDLQPGAFLGVTYRRRALANCTETGHVLVGERQVVRARLARYVDASRARLHHVVTCIRHGTTLAEAGALLRPNDEYRLKSGAEMARRFREERARAASPAQDPVRATLAIAERCAFTLHDLRYEFPRPRLPHGESALSFLTRLVHAGKVVFYPDASDEVEARLAHELDIVDQLGLAGYLLVFKEIVDWSQSQGILVSMRGSAPASASINVANGPGRSVVKSRTRSPESGCMAFPR